MGGRAALLERRLRRGPGASRRAEEGSVRRRSRGFTLVELAVAIAVMAILLLGLAVTLAMSARLKGAAREHLVAEEAARSKVEEILAWPDFSTLAASFDGDDFAVGVGSDALRARPGDADGLPGAVAIDTTDASLLGVRVTVEWRGVNGDDRVELNTKVSNSRP